MNEDVERGCDHEAIDCPICEGRMSPEFIARIKAAADQPGPVMTAEEFLSWLREIDGGSPHQS